MFSANFFILPLEIFLAGMLIAVLLRRGMHRHLPIFFVYVIYEIGMLILRLVATPHYGFYFKAYWTTEIGDVVLALACSYQCFVSTFRGILLLRRFRVLFPLLVCAVSVYSIWVSLLRTSSRSMLFVSIVIGLEMWFQYLIAGTFLLFLYLKSFLRLRKRTFKSGIILGFAVASFGMLLSTLVRSESGKGFLLVEQWAGTVAYLLAQSIWIAATKYPLEESEGLRGITAISALQAMEGYSSVLRKILK